MRAAPWLGGPHRHAGALSRRPFLICILQSIYMSVTTSATVIEMEERVPAGQSSPGRPAGRRLLRRDERRAQLLRAAATAFLVGGYAGTSLDDVAAQAGVTRMIIYRHFDSKRDLYREVLLDTRRRIEARIGPPDPVVPPGGHGRVAGAPAGPAR